MKTLFSAVSVRVRLGILAVSLCSTSIYGALHFPAQGELQGATQATIIPSPDDGDFIVIAGCKQEWFEYLHCVMTGGTNCGEEPDCIPDPMELGEILFALSDEQSLSSSSF